jgi:NADH-quinone oxidoreductase subunit L
VHRASDIASCCVPSSNKGTINLSVLQIPTHLLIGYLPLIIGILPLLAAVVAGLSRKQQPRSWLTTCLLALAMLLSGYLLVLTYHGATWRGAFTWLHIIGSPLSCCLRLGFCVDFPVAVMISLTTTINFFTHLYALAYMQAASQRYLILTGSFVSAMLAFLVAESLIARFVCWELIGLGSYLFISFWYQQETAAKNSTKTWLINQLGSMSLLIGILIIGSELDSFDLNELATLPKEAYRSNNWIAVARCCLVGGVLTKSAQFPWLNWLPGAMTAPTPASALIHTATMVGTGVYLLIGLAPILGTTALTWVAYLGGLTAFMGACVALTQQHVKQVLAYSTISQLGYAVMAVGVGASSVGLFHFVTHAFCKACLFLCIGVVSRFILQQNDANTMQHMGGLRKTLPGTFLAYLMAACSLVGIPGFAGSSSKEAVLAYTWAWAQQQTQSGSYLGYLVPLLGFLSSFLGIVYMGRQCYLVFMGTPQWSYKPEKNAFYHTPWLMRVSMFALALCSLGFWYEPLSGKLQDNWLLQRLADIPYYASELIITQTLRHNITVVSSVITASGLFFLVVWQIRSPTTVLFPPNQLVWCSGYLDRLASIVAKKGLYLSRIVAQFDSLVVSGLVHSIGTGCIKLGSIINWLDRKLLGGAVLLVALVPSYLGRAHRATQQGNLQDTLLWMFIGVGLLFCGIYWATQGM